MGLTKPRLTEEEFLRLPDNGRKYELVNGEAKEVPTKFLHDMIGIIIISYLMAAGARESGGLTSGQAGFRMANGNIRCPDVSFTRTERLPGGKVPNDFGNAAPDFCVEIISPSEDMADQSRKLAEYFDSGASVVWHVFPETRSIAVFTSPSNKALHGTGHILDIGDLLPGFSCPVDDLFATD